MSSNLKNYTDGNKKGRNIETLLQTKLVSKIEGRTCTHELASIDDTGDHGQHFRREHEFVRSRVKMAVNFQERL
jgi:hypothetical protein